MRSRWTRLLPVMMIAFIIAFMDRTNIGFAIPTMGKELALDQGALGFASGVLFLGYGVTQPLGGWIADRGYGRALIATLMVLWGVTEVALGYIETPTQLAVVRFLLGFFEGGIFPTLLLFVRNWFAPSERARANGVWQLAYPLAAMLSGPIAGFVLEHGTWRTLFIVEGIFPIVWAAVWLWGVAASPREARWLSDADREALMARLNRETELPAALAAGSSLTDQMKRPAVLLFTVAVFFWNIGFLGFIIWLPSVIHQDATLSQTTVGWLSAIPFAAAMVAMQFLTRLSDRTRDRRTFSAGPIMICGAFLVLAGLSYATNTLTTNMILLTLAGSMLYGSQPVLWSIPGDIVPRHLAGAVTGVMNAVGVLGAFAGPFLVGYVRTMTSSFSMGLSVLGGCLLLAGLLLFSIREAGPRVAADKLQRPGAAVT
ncbi:MFS transporter [Methylobacterium sp. J-070]|uniref:MFS transporter n=1 Tax=Methylobacterium sp. J-070 TaxID=2836650 RepID=UPI001FB890E2|nr:MFS transporter [Methylobacterium sp. J-070]MCJ2049375.1 MFS transporter [Methylobacterium sp. J-070]